MLTDYFKIKEFEGKYGYNFSNPLLLCEALTHTSFANEYFQSEGGHILHNERLEFLGDTVMGTIISTRIFRRFPDFSEGKLSKIRSSIVCEASLAECFLKNGLTEFIMLGKGEEMTGGRDRPSVLADCFEAIIGAIYLDGGFDAASDYVDKIMGGAIENGIKTYELADAKTYLQEIVRKIGMYTPQYKIIKTEGPDHNKMFTVRVSVITDEIKSKKGENILKLFGEGTGQSKKDAEQKAAMDFINKLKEEE